MAKVTARKETGRLLFDFTYRGVRCREQTALPDTDANRKRLEPILKRLRRDLADGTFTYEAFFPGSPMAAKFGTATSTQVPQTLRVALQEPTSIAVPQHTPSFRVFAEQWFEEHKIEWRRSHIRPLQSTLDGHLIKYFQDKPVGEIRREDIMAFRNHLASLPGRGGKAGLSNKRINGILGPLKQIMVEASERYGFTSPMINLKPLRVRKSDVFPFTLTEVQRLLVASRPDFKDYFLIRVFTGMRTGEAHGLKWKYVDFINRLILIRETFVLGEDEYTKTDGSQRDIQMSQPVYEALLRMHAATSKISEYVFCNREGKPLDNKNFTERVWYPLLRHLGLETRRPYQMRHTAATLWLAAGEAPEWIARQLGHATTEMLFTTYSRFVPNLTRQDGSAIDRLLSSRFGSGEIHIPDARHGQQTSVGDGVPSVPSPSGVTKPAQPPPDGGLYWRKADVTTWHATRTPRSHPSAH